jgi:hypothetical protein
LSIIKAVETMAKTEKKKYDLSNNTKIRETIDAERYDPRYIQY